MPVETFDPSSSQILLPVLLSGPRGTRRASFLFDTGSQVTSVDQDLIYEIGCSVREARRMSHLLGPGDSGSLGYVLTVGALEVLGTRHELFDVHVHDMPRDDGIDGLLGMDWLQHHVLTVNGRGGFVEMAP